MQKPEMKENVSNDEFSIILKGNKTFLGKDEIEEKEDIIEMICNMAYETEGKKLSKETIGDALDQLATFPSFGNYFLIIDTQKNAFCGLNMVTYEYNIKKNKIVTWIQTVFVKEGYRMKGLFRKLLKENEENVKIKGKESSNEASVYDQCIKLYMDKDNSKAEQVYYKVGFKVTDEILYELDYNFDDIKFINSENFSKFDLNKPDSGYSLNILGGDNDEDKNLIFDHAEDTFISFITGEKFQLKENIEGIKKVMNDRTLGEVVYVYNEGQEKSLIALFYIFHEFSDWRNSFFWWVNDFLVNSKYSDFVYNNMSAIIYTLVKLNYDFKCCGLRMLLKPQSANLLKNTVLLKSHYVIYEKDI